MAIRRIVKEGDPILRMKCRPVTEFGEKLNQLLDDMHETLEQTNTVRLLVWLHRRWATAAVFSLCIWVM